MRLFIVLFALVACGGSQKEVAVKGDDSELLKIAGDWEGDYQGRESGRTGPVRFSLAVGRHIAEGEVFMGGSVNVGVSATYTINYKFDDFEVGGVVVQPGYDAVGLLNYQLSATSLPEWKGSAFIEYSLDRHNLRFTLNYIDSYHDQRADIPGAGILAPNPQTGQVITRGTTIKSKILAELDYRVELPWDTTATLAVTHSAPRSPLRSSCRGTGAGPACGSAWRSGTGSSAATRRASCCRGSCGRTSRRRRSR